MPVEDLISPFLVVCDGGLVLDTATLSMPTGSALELQNFEPALNGGYRRIDGFTQYSTTEVTGTGGILGVQILGSTVVACRGINIMYGTGTTWTSIATDRLGANRYFFDKYDWNGTVTIVGADGDNYAFIWDGSTYTLMNGAIGSGLGTAPIAPTYVAEHKGKIFYAGYNNLGGSGAITYSSPYAPNDFSPANGAGEIQVGDEIVGIKPFREDLYIFCKNSIYKLSGSSNIDFQLIPVTRNIGCLSGHSIQEVGGDIVYLAPDGLRTIAGTAKIGDVELASISKQVQQRLRNLTTTDISSVVIRSKTQYRLFHPAAGASVAASEGLLGGIRRNIETGAVGWQYATIKGIKPGICASDYIGDDEYILHGGYADGYIYRQESGSDFDGGNIASIYRSPDFIMSQAGLRKILERININYETEGSVSFLLAAKLDYEDVGIVQPLSKNITEGAGSAVYGTAVYGTSVYGNQSTPILRLPMEGSGFAIGIEITDTSTNASFTIRGYELEVVPGGRK